MKIVFSPRFEAKYPTNPVECPERVGGPAKELKGYEFIDPAPASLKDISRVHGREHIERVKGRGMFDAASFAAGGAICAAELASSVEPAFALIRPPGHHASANRAWGMCFFNNMAIAVQKIRPWAKRVLIIDIDLHFGDGTASIFSGDENAKIVNPGSVDRNFDYLSLDNSSYIQQIVDSFSSFDYDIVGVSAGFDTYIEDWGGLLSNEDYEKIGRAIGEGSMKCQGKRFALLEGGYSPFLKYNIKSFIKGFE